ncbi:cytosine permease [Pseudonocardia sp. NPDC046786]|uniref:cytosine permease n=1 Tax=Pseudonocardia sp. NPDC046786 TaxID=3155471 RepID=UPI0033CE7862
MATPPTSAAPARTAMIDRDRPLERIPVAERKGVASVAVVIAGFGFFTPTMITGGAVASEFSFATFAVLALTAAAVLALYIAALGIAAGRTGLTTVLLSRLVLGRLGGKWASILLGGTQVGWYGITIAVLGDLLGTALGIPTWPVVLRGGIAMAVTAYYGFRGIEFLSWISVPLMTLLCGWIAVGAVGNAGGWSGLLAQDGAGTLSVGAALTLLIGTFVSGGTQIGNWTRFAAGGRLAFGVTAVTIMVVQSAMLLFGGIGAIGFGEPDFSGILIMTGSIGLAVFLIISNLWTTNDNVAYAFGVAGAELTGRPDKRPFIVGGVAVAIVLALTGVTDGLTTFLVVLGVLIPPLGGAIIGTFLGPWRRRDPGTALDAVGPVRLPGLLAYLGGTAAAVVGAWFDVGIPAVQGILVAALLAALLPALLPAPGTGRRAVRR